MKKYGINDHWYDDIPGFRDSGDDETWYRTESERDMQFDNLNAPTSNKPKNVLTDMMIEEDLGGDTTHSYTKIEKDE